MTEDKRKTQPKHSAFDLKQMQSLSLDAKIHMTKRRIEEWHDHWTENGNGCYVSFSGGKDSTVLKHLVDSMYNDVPSVFVDTGLEYPEIRKFVQEIKDGKYDKFNSDIVVLRPEMRFDEVVKEVGYPVISKEVADVVHGARIYIDDIKALAENGGGYGNLKHRYEIEKLYAIGRYSDGRQVVSNWGGQKNPINHHDTDMQSKNSTKWDDVHTVKQTESSLTSMGIIPNEDLPARERERVQKTENIPYSEILDIPTTTEELKAWENTPIRVLRLLEMLGEKNEVVLPTAPKNSRSGYNCSKYQYLLDAPFPIDKKCCDIMKKRPAHKYDKETGRKPFLGTMADESAMRKQGWMRTGCNAFDSQRPHSTPLAFWTEQDIYEYIVYYNLPIAKVYGDVIKNDKGKWETTGVDRTGCMFCMFGAHLEKSPNRFEMMKKTHPKQYEYCMKSIEEGGLGLKDVIDWINNNSDGKTNIKY